MAVLYIANIFKLNKLLSAFLCMELFTVHYIYNTDTLPKVHKPNVKNVFLKVWSFMINKDIP